MGKIQPAAHFCTAHELKMVFIFLNSLGENQKKNVMTCDKWHKIQISVSINKIINIASHIHLFLYYLCVF